MVNCFLIEAIQNIIIYKIYMSAPGQKVTYKWKHGKMSHGKLRRQCIYLNEKET